MSDEADCITLSSDDECQIVDDERKDDRKALASLKADLSQIRSFTSQRRNVTIKPVNGHPRPCPSSKLRAVESMEIPEEVTLDDDELETDNKIGYSTAPHDDSDLQIVDADDESSSSVPIIAGYSSANVDGSPELDSEDRDTLIIEGEEVEGEVESEDEEEEEENYQQSSEDAINAFCEEFKASTSGSRTKPQHITQAQEKVRAAYDAIKNKPKDVHIRLLEDVQAAIQALKCSSKSSWHTIKDLLDNMKPERIERLAEIPVEVRLKEGEVVKQKLLQSAEEKLKKIRKKIQKLEEEEVDWDDDNEHNSSYIMQEKFKKMMVEYYYKICDILKCSRFTGRPVQKCIRLKKHGKSSGYDDIDLEVEKFVNKKGFLFIPDFVDILKIVRNVNQKRTPQFTSDEESDIAKSTFGNVVKIIKKRREKDFKVSMLGLLPRMRSAENEIQAAHTDDDDDEEDCNERLADPAENDSELQKKLDENISLRKSEDEVMAKFTKLAEEKGSQPREVVEGENLDESPPPSDAEDNGLENEDHDDGENDNEEEDEEEHNAAADPNFNSHEMEELTEDEDEEPETIRVSVPEQPQTVAEGDDKSTDPSESDSNHGNGSDFMGKVVNNEESENDSSDRLAEKKRKNEDEVATDDQQTGEDEATEPPSKKTKPDENSNEPLSDVNVGVAVENVEAAE